MIKRDRRRSVIITPDAGDHIILFIARTVILLFAMMGVASVIHQPQDCHQQEIGQ